MFAKEILVKSKKIMQEGMRSYMIFVLSVIELAKMLIFESSVFRNQCSPL
jgi:hypothetical protein